MVGPVPTVPAGLTDVAEIATSSNHNCARRVSNEVVCWGRNTYGYLGDGTTTAHADPAPIVDP